MLQLHCFQLPDDEAKANEFLAAHKPAGEIHFQQDQMIVFIDEGPLSPVYQIADFEDLLRSVMAAKLQQEVAMNTLQYERADVNMVKNKGRYEELSAGIQSCKKALDMQDAKAAFLQKKIEELRNQK